MLITELADAGERWVDHSGDRTEGGRDGEGGRGGDFPRRVLPAHAKTERSSYSPASKRPRPQPDLIEQMSFLTARFCDRGMRFGDLGCKIILSGLLRC